MLNAGLPTSVALEKNVHALEKVVTDKSHPKKSYNIVIDSRQFMLYIQVTPMGSSAQLFG